MYTSDMTTPRLSDEHASDMTTPRLSYEHVLIVVYTLPLYTSSQTELVNKKWKLATEQAQQAQLELFDENDRTLDEERIRCPNCHRDPRDGVEPSPASDEEKPSIASLQEEIERCHATILAEQKIARRLAKTVTEAQRHIKHINEFLARAGTRRAKRPRLGVSRKNSLELRVELKLRFENGESTPRASIKPSQVQRA